MTERIAPTDTESTQDSSLENPKLRRAYEVEMALDPEHTLPAIELAQDTNARIPGGTLVPTPYHIVHDGKQIGSCTIVTNRKRGMRWFNGISIEEQYRGQGYGRAAYKEAIEQAVGEGDGFMTHEWSQTASAKKVWEALRDSGLADVVHEFESDGNGLFNGEYVIQPAEKESIPTERSKSF